MMDHDVVRLVLLTEKIEVAASNGRLSFNDGFVIRECARRLVHVVPEPAMEPDPSQFLIPF